MHYLKRAVVVCLALVLVGCASPTSSSVTTSQLSSGDKPSRVVEDLLAAHGCQPTTAQSCPSSEPATTASESSAPSGGSIYKRQILVEHENQQVVSITLYLSCKQPEVCEVIDSTGRSYSSLDDFRRHNTLLTSKDKMLVPRDFTAATSGNVDLITVSGHTASQGTPWLIIVFATVAVLILAGSILLLRHRTTSPADSSGSVERPSTP